MSELEALSPDNTTVKLESGTVVEILPLRTRQFFRLLKIVSHGAGPLLASPDLFTLEEGESAEQFGGKLLSVLLMSIPDAENETISFLKSMVLPTGLVEKPTKDQAKTNRELIEALDEELDNPELDDLVTLIEAIVKRESSDIQALGKRLGQMLKLAEKTGQLPSEENSQKSQEENSSEDSVEHSTS